MTKDLRYKNLAVIDPLFSPLINACSWIALNEDGDSGQSVSPTIIDGGSHAYASQSTKAHAKFTSSGTSVSMTTSFSNFFSLDNGVSILDADLTLLDADYTLIQQLLDGSLTTGLSFSASDVKHYYACCKGTLGSTTIRDTVGETDATITGHTDNCNDYFANVSYGLPTTRLIRNDDGEVESIASDYTAQFKSDGSNLPIGFTPNIPEYTLIFPYSGEMQNFASNVATNNTFDANIDGYTRDSSGTITWDAFGGGSAKIEATGSYSILKSTNASLMLSGETYLVTIDIFVEGTADYLRTHNGSGFVDLPVTYENSEWQTVTYEITMVNNYPLYFGFFDMAVSDSCYFDNIFIEKLTTKTQQDQIRVITHSESTSTDTYRINHVEQDTAILPDSDTAMTQSDIALLGYGDTITECLGNAEAYSYAMTTAQQLTRLNEMILANFDVLTDEFDVPLTDENGMYMYTR